MSQARSITRRKVAPRAAAWLTAPPGDPWAAVFGRIAVYSFIVALVSGVLLLPFFRPDMTSGVYHGSYRTLDGAPLSQAYQSVLAISFDVRGGLLIRQVHHWSADLFVAAICLRLLRVFFRGRFSGRALLWAAAANDQIACHLQIPLYTVTWIFRVLVLAGPALAFLLTRVICHALAGRRRDEERHGRETGRIVRNPQGGYTEIREPAHRAAPPGADPPGPASARQIGEGGPLSWTGRA